MNPGPSKSEIQEIFRRLRQIAANRSCFDCGAKNPTWSSVTFGVFICIDCSAVHRSLGVHVSFVRSTQLDTNWTWEQLQNMKVGGNANANTFFIQHHCSTLDAQQKYKSRAANLYREKLNQLVTKYRSTHGDDISFDSEENSSASEKQTDFFDEIHSKQKVISAATGIDSSACLAEYKKNSTVSEQNIKGPTVSGLSEPSSGTTSVRKSIIGQRKPGSKLGAKKSGLGAQKVKANFSDIEKEAEMLDQMKEKLKEEAKREQELKGIEEERKIASMSLAYQDLSKEQSKNFEKLKKYDPKKAEQAERLGMGIGFRSGVSHSMMSDMQTIDQETPCNSSSRLDNSPPRGKIDFFDEYEIVESLSSMSTSNSGYSKNSDWLSSKSSRFDDEEYKPKPRHDEASSFCSSDEAQKKFGSAKAISSDQFFSSNTDNDYERNVNLARFEGSTSISSADYFGDGSSNQRSSSMQGLQNVDLDDVKESVRQGVTKVAGKLSNLANGMMSSIQEKYGY